MKLGGYHQYLDNIYKETKERVKNTKCVVQMERDSMEANISLQHMALMIKI